MASEKIRESVIAGSWYPGDPQALRSEIQTYLDQASVPPIDATLVGLIAPHAGYIYSGGVAAHAYKLLERQNPFECVLILAPSHRALFKGASVYTQGGYRTPLGIVPLDRELIDGLLQHSDLVRYIPQADAEEHSLEIQLPFLQIVLKEFRLVPLVLGEQSFDFCRRLADAIVAECRGKKVLLVASSDLSHYHSYKEAKRLDQIVADRVEAFDPEGLWEALAQGECEACGAGPVMTLMLAAQKLGAGRAQVLRYANSGDVTGDTRGVVGYMAAAFFRGSDEAAHPNEEKTVKRVGVDLGLSEAEKQTLHEIASEAIRAKCLGLKMPGIAIESEKLKEHRGAFVCLHKGKELRGCIGMIEGRAPLHETIRDMAIQAAFADPRFCALEPGELDQIHLELSVLTPLERIHDPSVIEIGTHGLYIRQGYASGLLLPQVATEYGWDRVEFLEWTCRKAGLPLDAWKDPETEIYLFSADVF